MMKKLLYFSICSLFLSVSVALQAQNGPGGVDNSHNILWLDASQLNLSNNASVSTWADRSPLGNDATQATSSKQPIFKTAQLNGLSTIQFDGTDDYLQLDNNITTQNLTTFLVYKQIKRTPANSAIMRLDKHLYITGNVMLYFDYFKNQSGRISISKTADQFSILSHQVDYPNRKIYLKNELNNETYSFTGFTSNNYSTIGSSNISASGTLYFIGEIAEVIIFDKKINDARRKIVGEYLGGKYNLTTEAGLYNYQTDYGIDVKGIGKENNGSQTEARGNDSLKLFNASTLGNGDYVIVGSNGGDYNTTSSVGVGMVERWNKVWRVDTTGTPGKVDLTFYITGNAFANNSANYVVYIENQDGDFSNGGTTFKDGGNISSTQNSVSITFSNVSLNKGDYFTLAERLGDIESAQSGDWNTASTWNCNCIPNQTSTATILKGHTVTVRDNSSIFDLTVKGTLNFDNTTDDTLSIYNIFRMRGTLNANKGTIAALKPNSSQYFYNDSTNLITFNNLLVNNNTALFLENSQWAIENNVQVLSGKLDATQADSVILLSTATKTSQILPSISNAFSDNFTVQRFISARAANFVDIASPVLSTTFEDLDQDIFLSINGGNNCCAGNFQSAYYYSSGLDTHIVVPSVTTKMHPTYGYEVYLASTLSQFNGGIIDFHGEPNSGDGRMRGRYVISNYWNLIGNIYHSFINWSKMSTYGVPSTYYIFESAAGTYKLQNSATDFIAPEQGFWVYSEPTGGAYIPVFKEDMKVDQHSPTFLRKKSNPNFRLSLNNDQNPFSHQMEIAFDPFATAGRDEMDAPFLKSPIQTAPSITATPLNSSEEVVRDVVNPNEDGQIIPLNIGAGVSGNYTLTADNLEAVYQNYSCVFLKDKESKDIIDLSVEPNYQFTAKEGKSHRFDLVLSHSYDECHALLENGSVHQKMDENLQLRNSYQNWYLDYSLGEQLQQIEVSIYNLNGQLVKATQSFEANNAGTYRLRNLQDLKGIYLVQVKSSTGILNKTIKF